MIQEKLTEKTISFVKQCFHTVKCEVDSVETPLNATVTNTVDRVTCTMLLDSATGGTFSNFKVYDSAGALVLTNDTSIVKAIGESYFMEIQVALNTTIL